MKKITPYLIRALCGCSTAGAISLLYIFVHRVVLNLGGTEGGWLVHEDNYGPIMFGLFFLGFVLFPLPKKSEYILATARSLFLASAFVVFIYILGVSFPRSGFHLNNFIVGLGLLSFSTFLFTSRCFQELILKNVKS